MIVRVVALLLLLAPAHGEELRTQARQKFDEGREHFSAGRFQPALDAFKESYQLAPHPDLLFNIARCEEQLGHYRNALAAYERFLAVNPADPEARRRADEIRALAEAEPLPVEPSPTPSPSPPPPLVVQTAPPPPPTPLYRKWWLWTAVVGVAAVMVGVGLSVGLNGAEPLRTFPPLSAQ